MQTASRFHGIGRNAEGHKIWRVLNGALADSIAKVRVDFDKLVSHEPIRVFDTGEPPSSTLTELRATRLLSCCENNSLRY